MIPREIIDEIVYRSEITEVIGSYVTLKRAGSNFSGLCPFHSEKTPSFTVFPATKSFHCFGCGAGGDVINFIRRAENLDYVAAIEFLAQRCGVAIPETFDQKEQNGTLTRSRVYQINLEAAKFFRKCLFDEKLGKDAREYFFNKRQLSMATVKHFGLGFAPNDFGALGNHMRSLGFSDEELKACYLRGVSSKNGRYFDLFRNRVMFPIIDTSGNIIAFGGRVLDDSKPKYLNSSDTPGFKKSRNLFALNYAKNHASDSMILCEGYMDVIALHAAGFENAVATLGTAITSDQARIFSKYTKKVVICYDSDAAGQTAAEKAMRLLGEVGLEVRVLKLSGAKDPDEYIKTFGPDKFRIAVGESKSGFEHRLDSVLRKYDVTLPEEKIRASEDICKIIADVYSSVEREIYIGSAADRLKLPHDIIKNDVERIRRAKLKEYRAKESREALLSIKSVGDRVNPDASRNIAAAAAEEVILGLLLIYDEYRNFVVSGKIGLSSADFITDFGRRVFDKTMELHLSENGYSYSAMGEFFSADEMSRLQKMIQSRNALSENGLDVLKQSVSALKDQMAKDSAKKNEDVIGGIESIIKRKSSRSSANPNNT